MSINHVMVKLEIPGASTRNARQRKYATNKTLRCKNNTKRARWYIYITHLKASKIRNVTL